MLKLTLLHCGDDVMWNHDLYNQLQEKFNIVRSHSMDRTSFMKALQTKQFGDFAAIYRPFWSNGGEMGKWDKELMLVVSDFHLSKI